MSESVSHGMKLVPFHDNINEIFHKDKMDRSEQKTKLMQSCKSPMTNIRTCVRVSKTSDKGENTPCINTP